MLPLMKEIRWLESRPERQLLESLQTFDHHSIDIDGEPAVLMTYVTMESLEPSLLAVVHPAADRYPGVPRWVKDAMARLVWEPTLPPKS